MNETALSELLAQPSVWRAATQQAPVDACPTGLAALDRALPAGGWPRGALSEILLPADGVGELQLVLPALARLTREGDTVMVVAPPYTPYLPGWEYAGVDMCRVEFVAAKPQEALWVMEQGLRSGACAAVLGWPQRTGPADLRRLQLAAAAGQALGFIFRDRRHAAQASMAALRLELETRPCRVRVHKCRGGRAPSRLIAL